MRAKDQRTGRGHGREQRSRRCIGVILTCTTVILSSCGDGGPARSGPAPSDATRDPGSHIEPTNDLSFALLDGEPEARRRWFQTAIQSRNGTCAFPLSAILKAGDLGTDLWRVQCTNATWLVTIRSGGETSIDRCLPNARDRYCYVPTD